MLTSLLDEEEDSDENDFLLIAPDKFQFTHLFTQVRIYIGGKKPLFISCDLSKKHIVKDVIKHALTVYRRDKKLKS
jgi:hypothetical protein